jgi:hypothetical protein
MHMLFWEHKCNVVHSCHDGDSAISVLHCMLLSVLGEWQALFGSEIGDGPGVVAFIIGAVLLAPVNEVSCLALHQCITICHHTSVTAYERCWVTMH